MWQIDNRTPFSAAQSWIRDQNGAETWIVALKATFDVLSDGSLVVSKNQPEPARSAIYRDEPGRSSILYENDFVLAKRTTDVLVNGTAYAPDSGGVRSLDVGIRVGSVQKALRIFGDRTWTTFGRLSAPERFTQMPVTYERAFGGVDSQSPHPDVDWYWPNPVGTGFVTSQKRLPYTRPPNIEYANQLITRWNSRPDPAGFGVIASHWSERAAYAGTYDDVWTEKRQPLLPLDFDIRHYQAAPSDQQTSDFLVGGEPVLLKNLTPSGTLRFVLPTIVFAFQTRFMDGERREHDPPSLHSVILEPDFPRVSLVWHSALECHSKVYDLETTRIEVCTEQVDTEEELDSLLDII